MRSVTLLASAAIACAVGLAGCNRHDDTVDNHAATAASSYCAGFKTSNGTGVVADPSAAVDDCIHRWAYVLSRGHDPADVVAHATLEACSTPLTTWSQQIANAPQADETVGPSSGYGRRGGGDPSAANPMAQRMGMANAKALFYVVQARAGSCALPPSDSLVAPPNPG